MIGRGRRRAALLAVAAAGAALGGCGPDCDRYCARLAECGLAAAVPVVVDVASCRRECDAAGGQRAATVSCVADRTCAELAAGRCTPTGDAPKAP